MKRFLNSFKYAMNGIMFSAKYERNMRIHIVVMLYVLYFTRFYDLTKTEIILLVLTIVIAITTEMINTSIEVVIDKVSPHYHTLAKIGKDVAAGAVLIATIGAIIIGLILFWNVEIFKEIWEYFTGKISNLMLLLASFAASLIFINLGKKRRKHMAEKIEKEELQTDEK
jgi:diacylglycerol kinase (ATP)